MFKVVFPTLKKQHVLQDVLDPLAGGDHWGNGALKHQLWQRVDVRWQCPTLIEGRMSAGDG
jgi:hypothetical protein